MANSLRGYKVKSGTRSTAWLTRAGGLFIEPVQHPDPNGTTVTLTLDITTGEYKLLEALHGDVAGYINRLVSTHVQGLVKSAQHNRKVKNGNRS